METGNFLCSFPLQWPRNKKVSKRAKIKPKLKKSTGKDTNLEANAEGPIRMETKHPVYLGRGFMNGWMGCSQQFIRVKYF